MRKQKENKAVRSGVTLVELVVSILILSVASLGALSYQYHAVKRAKIARAEVTATQLAQMVLEDWKSRGGDEFYNPEDLHMGFTELGSDQYKIILNDFPMFLRLWHQDMETDASAGVTLRQIRISIQWRRDYLDLAPSASADPVYVLSTYVRRDQSGG